MGGSGAPMFAIRHPERIAWAASWVGVHIPQQSPTFRNSYANVYGQPEWNVTFEDGTPVWDYFDDAWYLRKHPQAEIGLIAFSNGKNDGGIGWPQAVEFYRALQETRRPHLFVWGQQGHGQRAAAADLAVRPATCRWTCAPTRASRRSPAAAWTTTPATATRSTERRRGKATCTCSGTRATSSIRRTAGK